MNTTTAAVLTDDTMCVDSSAGRVVRLEDFRTAETTATAFDFSGMNIDATYTEDDILDCKEEFAADPIKSTEDINRLRDYLLRMHKYRDYMMLIVGINTGLRYSDFSKLRFRSFIDPEKVGTSNPFRDELVIEEQKTKHTKKHRVNRHIAVNDSIKVAINRYLNEMAAQGRTPKLDDYLFTSNSNNGGNLNKPMSAYAVRSNFQRYAEAVKLNMHFGTHTFRKTFGYWYMRMNGNDTRALCQLQVAFNHSSANITLRYIGLTADEIRKGYEELNLGL